MPCTRTTFIAVIYGLVVALDALLVATASAENFLLAMSREWPGAVYSSTGGAPARPLYRHVEGSRELSGAIPRITAVTHGASEGTFVASGLDGAIFKLEGARPRLLYQHPGQIRDIALENGEGRIYFSVLPTPRPGETLADGDIWYFDLRTSRPSHFATITQSMVGGDFWGTFAIHGGVLYAATLTPQGHIYRIFPGGRSELSAETNLGPIHGLAFNNRGELYLATGTGKIYRSHDFRSFDTALLDPAAQFTDVTLQQ